VIGDELEVQSGRVHHGPRFRHRADPVAVLRVRVAVASKEGPAKQLARFRDTPGGVFRDSLRVTQWPVPSNLPDVRMMDVLMDFKSWNDFGFHSDFGFHAELATSVRFVARSMPPQVNDAGVKPATEYVHCTRIDTCTPIGCPAAACPVSVIAG